MNLQYIRDEVEKRVANRLPAMLLEKGILSHARHAPALGCICDYCCYRRRATTLIASTYRDDRPKVRQLMRDELRSLKQVIV